MRRSGGKVGWHGSVSLLVVVLAISVLVTGSTRVYGDEEASKFRCASPSCTGGAYCYGDFIVRDGCDINCFSMELTGVNPPIWLPVWQGEASCNLLNQLRSAR